MDIRKSERVRTLNHVEPQGNDRRDHAEWSRRPEPGCRVSTGRVPTAGLLHADDSRHGAVAMDDGSYHPCPKTAGVVYQPPEDVLAVDLKHTLAIGA